MTYSIENTIEEVVGEIIMSKKKYIILEGKTDVSFWEAVLQGNEEDFVLIGADRIKSAFNSNKKTVIQAIEELNKHSHKSFGIVDLDYDLFSESPCDANDMGNIYFYSAHSLETVIFNSDILLKVINVISSRRFTDQNIDELRKKISEVIRIKGFLRIANEQEILGDSNSCNKIKIDKFYNKKNLTPRDIDEILRSLQGSWKLTPEKIDILKKKIFEFEDVEDKYMCHGHDLFSMLENIIGTTIIPTPDNMKYKEAQIINLFIAYYDSFGKTRNVPFDLIGDFILETNRNLVDYGRLNKSVEEEVTRG
ncbi:DUF4435 domain-containing protein [Listeria rustica]|uniref:DUF4435 domain-containing protein n=1 Tax=Listeria rustica TaxID=2713503 RepID=A0A7W1YG47_9LIST|nr:DUF4435 domain-containing protein [Listeria rustica]MBA3926400.1 DUF4435 domain-containing protein [Listeria rustica]